MQQDSAGNRGKGKAGKTGYEGAAKHGRAEHEK
jgi:hypothetical protein